MSEHLTTPWDVADAFLTKFTEYRNGTLSGPVLDYKMSQGIVNSIGRDPVGMINFFVQTNYLIKHGLDDKFGKDSETSILGFMEWSNLTYSLFIPVLSLMLNTNRELMNNQLPELLPDYDHLGVPEGDPSEVFKNIEFSMDWITPEESSDNTPPEASGKTEDKPE